MPQEVTLTFETDDDGLNLTGTVNFPNAVNINGISQLHVRGLAEWRHVPANIVHVNRDTIERLRINEKAKNFSKIGMNFIGIQARSELLIAASCRKGKNGTKKVQEQLTKFFKALGASSIKFSILDVDKELASGEQNRDDNDEL